MDKSICQSGKQNTDWCELAAATIQIYYGYSFKYLYKVHIKCNYTYVYIVDIYEKLARSEKNEQRDEQDGGGE